MSVQIPVETGEVMQVFSQGFYLQVSALLQNSGCMPCKLWIHALQFVDSCLAYGIQILPEKQILDSSPIVNESNDICV